MHAPRVVITGTGGGSARLDAWLFGTICALAILVALAPLLSRKRIAWLGCVAPFALMALVGAILYHVLSQDLFTDDGSFGDGGSQVIQFANSLAGRIGGLVSRQVHVGAGGYLALAFAAVLAVKGLLNYQNSADPV